MIDVIITSDTLCYNCAVNNTGIRCVVVGIVGRAGGAGSITATIGAERNTRVANTGIGNGVYTVIAIFDCAGRRTAISICVVMVVTSLSRYSDSVSTLRVAALRRPCSEVIPRIAGNAIS
jgi:hypothetical protein